MSLFQNMTSKRLVEVEIFPMSMIKTFLRVHHAHDDELLTYLMQVSLDLVENEFNKTLLLTKRTVEHDNVRFVLPFAPVVEIQEVKCNGRVMQPADYKPRLVGDSQEVNLPFAWKDRTIQVTYLAGYGKKAEDIPSALRHEVLRALEMLYENRSVPLEERKSHWLRARRSYHNYLVG